MAFGGESDDSGTGLWKSDPATRWYAVTIFIFDENWGFGGGLNSEALDPKEIGDLVGFCQVGFQPSRCLCATVGFEWERIFTATERSVEWRSNGR